MPRSSWRIVAWFVGLALLSLLVALTWRTLLAFGLALAGWRLVMHRAGWRPRATFAAWVQAAALAAMARSMRKAQTAGTTGAGPAAGDTLPPATCGAALDMGGWWDVCAMPPGHRGRHRGSWEQRPGSAS